MEIREHTLRRLKSWGPWAAMVALALWIMAPATLGGEVLFWGVIAYQFVPWYRVAAELWRAGALPLWNPWVGGGAPLLANYQTAALYPPTWLMIAVPPERALGWLVLAHLLLAGAGMYAWGRARGLSRASALVGALAVEGCAYLVTRASLFPSVVFTFAWIPVWLWRAERLAQRPGRRTAARLALVVGLGLLAGHAQSAVYGLALVALLLAWRGLQSRATLRRTAAWTLVALVLGAGLAAAQLWPTAAYMSASVRSAGVDEHALDYSLWPWRAITFFAPDFFGHPAQGNYEGYPTYWEGAGYVGLAPLLLALGLVLRRKNAGEPGAPPPDKGPARFWALVAALALLLALGKFLPGYTAAFEAVPLLRIFNAPARRLLVAEIALAALAALALEPWLAHRPQRWQALPMLAGLVLALVGGLATGMQPELVKFGSAALRTGVLLALWGLLALLRGKVGRPVLVGGLLALVLADLALWGRGQMLATGRAFYAGCEAPALAEAWRAEPEPGRVLFAGDRTSGAEYDVRFAHFQLRDWTAGWQTACETLLPNLGTLAQVPFADNEDPVRLGRWERLEALAMEHPRLLPLLGVTHRLDERCAPDEAEIAEATGLRLCRASAAPRAAPRAWIVPHARRVPAAALPAALIDAAFDPRAEVLLEAAPPLPRAGGHGTVIQLRDRPNGVTIEATSDGPAYLVLADAWATGWVARLNGEAAPVLPANLALRAIPLPDAGTHHVTLRYRPRALSLGLLISGLSCFALFLLTQHPSKR